MLQFDYPLKPPNHWLEPQRCQELAPPPFLGWEGAGATAAVLLGERVALGQPLATDRAGRIHLSPCAGSVVQLSSGESIQIVLERADQEPSVLLPSLLEADSSCQLLDYLNQCGLLAAIYRRPFRLPASPARLPSRIFISSLNRSLPATTLITGREREWEAAAALLDRLAPSQVHLVSCDRDFQCDSSVPVNPWLVGGSHPLITLSYAVHQIDPILHSEECVWELSLETALDIGFAVLHRQYSFNRFYTLGGAAMLADCRGVYWGRKGCSAGHLILGRMEQRPSLLIAGNPLSSRELSIDSYLGAWDEGVCILPALPYEFNLPAPLLRRGAFAKCALSAARYGRSDALLLHKELIESVLPMRLSTTALVAALQQRDWDEAVGQGVLEVVPEDFAMTSWVCPSKWDWMGKVLKGQQELLKNGFVL